MSSFHTLASVALALLIAVTVAAGGAVAQPDVPNESVPNGSDVQGELPGEDEPEQEIEEHVDGDVVLVSYEFRDGELRLDLRHDGERPKTVTVVEMVQRTEGAGQMSIEQQRLIPGESTIAIDVEKRSGEAAVAISTQDSIDEGRAVFVSSGTNAQWFDGPASWGLVFLAVVAAGYGTFWGTRRYLEKQERERNERKIEVVR